MVTTTKKKIAITDDDNFLLDMYSLKFSESGFEVMPCLGSDTALQLFRSGTKPDIALFDIVMPTMDGFELVERRTDE
jgi:DNA-binding response OmpR family regulator